MTGGKRKLMAFVLILVAAALAAPCLAEEAIPAAPGAGAAPSLVDTWGPVIVRLLIAAGAIAWLRDQLQKNKLIKKYHLEGLVAALADRAVKWAENYAANSGGLTGAAKKVLAREKLSEGLKEAGVPATETTIDMALEAAHRNMEAASNFPPAASSISASEPAPRG